MEKEKILQKAQNKKDKVGKMERTKINKGNWISIVVAGCLAVALMVVEGVFEHRTSIFAMAAICFTWASVFYFCQYFIAKRKWPVLIGAILEGLGALIMITNLILCYAGVI